MKFQSDLDRCGKNLSRLREKQRITVDALAVLSGVLKDSINNFERGKGGDMPIGDLLKIAEVLDIELIAIFSRHGS
jgi:transcriptional regulator with XRE-family HTH domain